MTEMLARLTVTADAGSVVVAGRASGEAVQKLIDKTLGLDRAAKRASQSGDVLKRDLDQQRAAVDQLRRQYIPMYAASKQFETSQRALKVALQNGDVSLREHDQLLEALQAEYRRTEAAQEALTRSTGRWSTVTRGGAGGMQNFAFQLQDIFTQIGMGVPLMISLGQQAPQILSGFGTVGATLGVVAAAVLPLSAAVFGLGYAQRGAADDAETFEDRLDKLSDAIDRYREVSRAANADTADLREEYGVLTSQARRLLEVQERAARTEAMQRLAAVVAEMAGQFERISDLEPEILRGSIGGEEAIAARVREIHELASGLEGSSAEAQRLYDELLGLYDASREFPSIADALMDIREELGLTHDQAAEVAARFIELSRAEGPAQQADAAQQLIAAFEEALGPQEEMNENAREIINSLIDAGLEALRLGDGLAGAQVNAALLSETATRIADEIQRAVDASIELSAQGISDLRRSELELQFRGDPVGRAAAIAREEFSAAQAPLREGASDGEIAYLDAQTDAYVRNAAATEENRQSLIAWRRAQSRSGRGGRGGQSDVDRTIRDIERQLRRLAPSYEADLARAERWREEALANLNEAGAGYETFAQDVETIYREQLAAAYEADLERRTDWRSGIERANAEILENQLTWADTMDDLLTGTLERGEEAWVEWVTTGRASLQDVVDFALEQFARMAYQQSIQPALSGIFDFAAGLFGGGSAAPALKSHTGSVVGHSSVSHSQSGPLASDERLTITKVGQSIFTPRQLENGAAIVNALAQAAARPSASEVTGPLVVINDRRSSGTIEERQRSDGVTEINIMDQVEREMAGRAQRAGSPLNTSLRAMGVRPSFGRGQG
jgi:hypothetical protein